MTTPRTGDAAVGDSDEVTKIPEGALDTEEELSTDRWGRVNEVPPPRPHTSGVMRSIMPSIPPPASDPRSGEDSLLAPLPSPPPPVPAPLDEPFNPLAPLARGSGGHPTYERLARTAAPSLPPPRTITITASPATLAALGASLLSITVLGAYAGARLAQPAPPESPLSPAVAAVNGSLFTGPTLPPPPPAAAPVTDAQDPVSPPAPMPAAAPPPPPPSPTVVPAPAAAPSCPPDMVLVSAEATVCIDRFEAPGEGRVPTTGITRGQAAAACSAAGKRLCTGKEWERACRGAKGASYPWGWSAARFPTPGSPPCNLKSGLAPRPAGTLASCRSASGAFDLSGNAAEWVANGAPRGGSGRDGHDGRCSRPRRAPASGADDDLGFRCCASAR